MQALFTKFFALIGLISIGWAASNFSKDRLITGRQNENEELRHNQRNMISPGIQGDLAQSTESKKLRNGSGNSSSNPYEKLAHVPGLYEGEFAFDRNHSWANASEDHKEEERNLSANPYAELAPAPNINLYDATGGF